MAWYAIPKTNTLLTDKAISWAFHSDVFLFFLIIALFIKELELRQSSLMKYYQMFLMFLTNMYHVSTILGTHSLFSGFFFALSFIKCYPRHVSKQEYFQEKSSRSNRDIDKNANRSSISLSNFKCSRQKK